MRNCFIIFSLLCCLHVPAQDTSRFPNTDTSSLQQSMEQTQRTLDSLAARESFRQNADRSMQNFLNYQRARDEKQKKKAYMYIGFGLAMLVVLVIGLRRRVKK